MNCLNQSNDGLSSAAPLVFPVCPVVGESVAETVLRATADNSYRKVGHVLSAAGIEYKGNVSVAAKAQGRERDLSATLGMSDELLREIIPYPTPNRPGWSDFFGIPLRLAHRSMKRRRLSPRSLRQSLHLKAIWSVKVFSFDPQTKEILLERCPECSRQPTYQRTYGVQYCEYCSTIDELGVPRGRVDFRDFPQPVVEVCDAEALNFVTDLIDPEAGAQHDWHGLLHSDLRELGNSALFELVVALGLAVVSKPTTTARERHTVDYSRLQPDVLARVGRSLLSWPKGFDTLADEVRSNAAERAQFYGVRKELGPLNFVTYNKNLPLTIRSLMKGLIKQNMIACGEADERVCRPRHRPANGMVAIQEVAAKYGVARKSLSRLARDGSIASLCIPALVKSPILVNDAEVAELVTEKSKCISGTETSVRLGIPRISLSSLGQADLLRPTSKPRLASRGNIYFTRSSVEELEQRCLAAAQAGSPPRGSVSILAAVVRLRMASSNPWAGIISKIFDGQLTIWRSNHKGLMYALRLSNTGELKGISYCQDLALDNSSRLTVVEAAVLLGTDASKMGELIKRGFVPARPTVEELRHFTSKFVLTSGVAFLIRERGHRCRWREIPPLLRSAGIEPVTTLICNRGLVWPRLPVMQEIENRFPV